MGSMQRFAAEGEVSIARQFSPVELQQVVDIPFSRGLKDVEHSAGAAPWHLTIAIILGIIAGVLPNMK